jgi:hypothetical protein
MTALSWGPSGDVTTDGVWSIQTERIRGEPPLRYIMGSPPGFREWVRLTDHETAWWVGPAAARRHTERLAAEFAQSQGEDR